LIILLAGRGSGGNVYKAAYRGLSVAVKELENDTVNNAHFLSELYRETQVVYSLYHPNIVAVFGCTQELGLGLSLSPSLVMELLPRSLHTALHASNEPLSIDDKTRICFQVTDALNYLHTRRKPIVHGDLKPRNIMLDHSNIPKIIDFGLSTMHRTSSSSHSLGTYYSYFRYDG
jgi:serine/threonine protein kinase